MPSLGRNIAGTFITRVVIIGMGIIASIITARYLGPAGKGIIAILTVITGTVLQFGNFGLHTSNTYFILRERNRIPDIVMNSLITGIVGGLITIFVTYIIVYLSPNLIGGVAFQYLIIVLVALPASFLLLFFQNMLIGFGRIKSYNIIEFVISFLNVVGITLLLIVFRLNVLSLLIFTTAVTCLTAVMYVYTLRQHIHRPVRFDSMLFRRMLGYGYKSYLSSLFAFFIIRSDILLLNYFRGVSETGIYSLAVQFSDFLYLLPMISGLLLFPTIAGIRSSQEQTQTTLHLSRHISLIMVVICFLGAIGVYPLFWLFYGPAFIQATIPFWLLLPGIYCLSIEMLLMQDFSGRGMPPIVYIAPGVGLIFNIVVNYFAIPVYGMAAAAVTSSLGYFIVLAIAGSYYNRLTGASWKQLLIPQVVDLRELVSSIRRIIIRPAS